MASPPSQLTPTGRSPFIGGEDVPLYDTEEEVEEESQESGSEGEVEDHGLDDEEGTIMCVVCKKDWVVPEGKRYIVNVWQQEGVWQCIMAFWDDGWPTVKCKEKRGRKRKSMG